MEWDARGLVQVIKACASEKVTKFRLDSLEITFSQKPDTMVEEQEVVQQELVYKPMSEEDISLAAEMRRDELMISDPLAYENEALGEETPLVED